ncbi:MAG: selenite/tellurite reduction operon porin ExtI [Gammaproteobacteria bacterium]|nr:selenite/tellurite reduction operon porin ExtI [Gammaproteobacteria bacterium]MCW8840344.1 selenite/tellurite reduction operon porin ExtI [Gammaproteobacteria bacterium]MCW8928596.1 selenite/tellurite reduction operon porin ExtI [Gammaproteobacteria bacterium]MCW8959632.1 selenite/tellurite reduction operon porin ExtI [Gammaproteobacteria bacterium]MCW8973540.1 selenite/tellurite reduction operon porin ExtI [Gammaproteobacteria bacterium]
MKKNPTLRYTGLSALALAISSMGAHAGPSFQVGDQGYMELSYAVQIWAQNRGYTSSTDNGDMTDTFLRRNRITLNGQYNDYIGFYAQLEAGNDSKGGEDDRSVYYRDAYLTLDYRDELRFILGRYKNTFSRENLEACLEPLTLDRSTMSYTPFGGSRDTGATVWGNLADAMFQYRLSVSDGREADEVVKDSPRITGRVHVSLFEPEYSYGYRGTYLGTQKVLTIGAAFDSQSDVAYDNYGARDGTRDYDATTYDIFYEQPFSFGTLTASAAAFDYSVDGYPVDPDPALTPWVEREGNYVKVGYLFPKPVGMGRLQLFARGDDVEYGEGTGLSDTSMTSFGANYYINGQSLKVTLEHASMEFDEQHPTNPALQDYDQTTLGLQVIF